jgi:ubiquinone/menaquinone biosynthesis C-methylase UbiE
MTAVSFTGGCSAVDYDRTPIPELYAQARRLPGDAMAVWSDAVREMQPPDPAIRRILDLGCGTARFTAMLGNVYGARVIGVDPSQRMLAQREPATDRAARFVAANAEALPLGTSTVDLVFLSMVYHHLRPEAAVAEIARVVRRGGAVFVRTPTLDTVAAFEYMRFFPEALAFDRARACRIAPRWRRRSSRRGFTRRPTGS